MERSWLKTVVEEECGFLFVTIEVFVETIARLALDVLNFRGLAIVVVALGVVAVLDSVLKTFHGFFCFNCLTCFPAFRSFLPSGLHLYR